MHCNALQRIATHCNTLHHTARHCNTLQITLTRQHISVTHVQFTATNCNALQRTVTHCNTLQHTATHCTTLQTTLCSYNPEPLACICVIRRIHVAQSNSVLDANNTATQCNTLQHTATHCNTLQHTASGAFTSHSRIRY